MRGEGGGSGVGPSTRGRGCAFPRRLLPVAAVPRARPSLRVGPAGGRSPLCVRAHGDPPGWREGAAGRRVRRDGGALPARRRYLTTARQPDRQDRSPSRRWAAYSCSPLACTLCPQLSHELSRLA
eukprot:103339-Prymnesium_polylepis.1